MSNRITFHFKKGKKSRNLQERIEAFARRAVKKALNEQLSSDPDAPLSFDNSDQPVGSAPGGGFSIAKDWAKLPEATRCEWCKRNPGKVTPQINGRNVAGPRCQAVLAKCMPGALGGFSDPDDMESSEFDQGREDPDAYSQEREIDQAMRDGQKTSSTYPESVPEDPDREPVAKRRSTCNRAKATQARVTRAGKGPSVDAIQRELGLKEDGIYGPKTCAAIRKFQKSEGLKTDGVVGEKTWLRMKGSAISDDIAARSAAIYPEQERYVQGSGRLYDASAEPRFDGNK